MRNQFRVQAPDIRGPEPLRPAPLPGDTFTGAPAKIIDNEASRIADALGAFNTNLLHFGTAAAASWKKQQHDTDMLAANQIIGTTSRPEVLNMVREGRLPNYADPYANAAIHKWAGQSAAEDDIAALEQQRRAGAIRLVGDDPTQQVPNVEDIVTGKAQERFSSTPLLQSSNNAMAGYRAKIESYRDSLMTQQMKEREVQNTTYREGIAVQLFNKQFDDPNLTPEQVNANVRSVYKELGSSSDQRKLNLLSHQQLDKKLIDVLNNRAADPNFAAKAAYVLTAERQDEAGNKLPPLAANPAYATQVENIRKNATTALANRFETDTKQVAIKSAENALEAKDGSFSRLSDTTVTNQVKPTDPPFIVKAEDAKQKAVTNFLTKSAQTQAQNGESPEVRFEREWDVMSSNNVAHPTWKAQLSDGAKALTSPSALSNPAQREQAIATGELYMKLSERNYPYLKSTLNLDKQADDTWTVYRAARVGMGLNQDQALEYAAKATQTPENENDLSVRAQQAAKIKEKIAATNWSDSFAYHFPFLSPTTRNVSDIQKRIADVASVLVRVPGLSADDAVKYAAETVASRSMFVNGNVVPDIGPMSKWQQPYVEGYLKKFFDQHGTENGVESPKDLTVQPAGGGGFSIWSNAGGIAHPLYVMDNNGKAVPATITAEMLSQAKQADEGVAAYKAQRASEKARDRALLTAPDETLTPEARQRRSEVVERDRKATSEAFGRYGLELAGVDLAPPAQTDSPAAMMKSIRDGAAHGVDLLTRLGSFLKSNRETYGEIVPGSPVGF